ncbi:hypothetical protein HDU98_003274 [Podochytrium sp. JEL0797]|nr:hypothetical protein HDU98_003274 [Podochytrium sp. JEL0797]
MAKVGEQSSKTIANVLETSLGTVEAATTQILLTALTYCDKYFEAPAKNQFPRPLDGSDKLQFKILLSTLICGYKYCNDSNPVANTAWTNVTDKFTISEINAMEREFLAVINYSLVVEDTQTQKRWLDTIQEIMDKTDAFLLLRCGIKQLFIGCLESRFKQGQQQGIYAQWVVTGER